MKNVKKLLAMCLAVIMMISCIPAVYAADVANATIDPDAKGSLTLFKYDLTNAEKDGVWDSSYVSTGVYDENVNKTLGDASLSETSAYHLLCYAPVDLKESFEFVRKVALNGKDEEILKMYYDFEFSLQDIAEELEITDTQVHERIVRALRKLRHPKYFDLIRYGMKTTVRELIRMESECGFQDGFHRGIEDRWEDVDEETGEMNVRKDVIPWLQSTPIEDLQLPIRIINCLHRNEVVTVAELVQLQDKDILAMNGIGKTALKDIRKKQSEYFKDLLIELVTDEITEISTREVVNNLGGTV